MRSARTCLSEECSLADKLARALSLRAEVGTHVRVIHPPNLWAESQLWTPVWIITAAEDNHHRTLPCPQGEDRPTLYPGTAPGSGRLEEEALHGVRGRHVAHQVIRVRPPAAVA